MQQKKKKKPNNKLSFTFIRKNKRRKNTDKICQ